MKYYKLKNILAKNATYNMIFGERSNGKTFALEEYGIKQYVETGEQMALVRRWQDDFVGKRGSTMFDGVVNSCVISQMTNGEWTNVYYYASKWYLCRFDKDGNRTTDVNPFCYGFALTSMEHDKSTSYPEITTIVFDEFLSRSAYLPDEFVLFMNVISTIVRQRTNVKIFMLGNTVNKYCPYFAEMGLKHVKDMKPGTIDVYKYGNSNLTVAVEYAKPSKNGKPSDMYFAFDNPKLQMITGGAWEIDIYPHCPTKIKPKDIIMIYYIIFDSEILQCEIILQNDMFFTFIHRKTTPIADDDTHIVYSTDFNPAPNHHRYITRPMTQIEHRIADFYKKDKIYYADNEVGEIVRNYLIWCGKHA